MNCELASSVHFHRNVVRRKIVTNFFVVVRGHAVLMLSMLSDTTQVNFISNLDQALKIGHSKLFYNYLLYCSNYLTSSTDPRYFAICRL